MARPKKAISKKPSPKASTKSPAKKQAVKSSKAKKGAEDAALNQRFIESLVSLEKYWNKKVVTLKKQLATLQAKHDKATKKGTKSAKNDAARKQRQEEIAALKQEFANAKLAASKFAALSKKIEQFEREWLQKLAEDAKPKAATTSEKKKSQKTPTSSKNATKAKSPKLKPIETVKTDVEPEELVEAFEAVEEELMDDLEDIFMPQEEISEFEVIEDFSVAEDEDFDDYNS